MAAAYPRDVAVRVLTRVLSDHEHLDEALAAAVSGPGGGDGARAWLQEVCSGTLRWKGRLDQVIDSAALKKKPSGWLRKMLLVAAYQLVVQERTQPSAVVFETVEGIKRKEGDAPARFANALLRKIADHCKEWRELPFPSSGSAQARASWASLPEWLWVRLVADHGEDWARAYALASLERPSLWVRARANDSSPRGSVPGPVPGSFLIQEGGRPDSQEGFARGDFFVQDISSQLLVHEISARVQRESARPGLRALDVCAAPGGKSVGLAWNGFEVTAGDRDGVRLALLRQTLGRVASQVRILEGEWPQGQDLIWVDAPCSGTGILRRHPDVRWLRREKELPGLLKNQEDLLGRAWSALPSGGFLAYSVCSVLAEEGPGALERTGLSRSVVEEWKLAPQQPPGGDGFFAALLRKP